MSDLTEVRETDGCTCFAHADDIYILTIRDQWTTYSFESKISERLATINNWTLFLLTRVNQNPLLLSIYLELLRFNHATGDFNLADLVGIPK